jgi:hypothetical protein
MKDALHLCQLVQEEAKKMGVSPVKAVEVWQQSYDLHKKIHGSYKAKTGAEYPILMNQRYEWCYSQCMEYIHEQARLKKEKEAKPA